MIISEKTWKVGELAEQTGLTVRMLHHYDKIGLFSPSQHSDAGHRIYTETDLPKLQQIISLKQLGFSLKEIKQCLQNPDFNPKEIIELQLDRINEEISRQQELRGRLEEINDKLSAQRDVKAEQFIKLIEVIHMNMNKDFTPAQLEKLKALRAKLTPEQIETLKAKRESLPPEQLEKLKAKRSI